jgi:hypothetical protein
MVTRLNVGKVSYCHSQRQRPPDRFPSTTARTYLYIIIKCWLFALNHFYIHILGLI